MACDIDCYGFNELLTNVNIYILVQINDKIILDKLI